MSVVCIIAFTALFGRLAVVAAEELQPVPIPADAQRLVYLGKPRWSVSDVFTSRSIAISCTREVRLEVETIVPPIAGLAHKVSTVSSCWGFRLNAVHVAHITLRNVLHACSQTPLHMPGSFMQFKVFCGSSEDEIQAMYAQGASSWCSGGLSWDTLFQAGVKHCDVTISPFGTTLLAIVPNDDPFGSNRKMNCSQTEHAELSLQLISTGVAGVVLAITAPLLATSITFRMSVGGVLSVLLFTLIIAFVFFRCCPCHACRSRSAEHWGSRRASFVQPASKAVPALPPFITQEKPLMHVSQPLQLAPRAVPPCGWAASASRPQPWHQASSPVTIKLCRRFNSRGSTGSLLAALVALGVSATGAVNFWFRFPDIPDLLTSRYFLVYVAVSFLVGMAFAYYFDTADSKLMDILCTGLRIVGGLMVFYSLAQLWELACVALVLLTVAVIFLLPGVGSSFSGPLRLVHGARLLQRHRCCCSRCVAGMTLATVLVYVASHPGGQHICPCRMCSTVYVVIAPLHAASHYCTTHFRFEQPSCYAS
jgi:hypothetical protein